MCLKNKLNTGKYEYNYMLIDSNNIFEEASLTNNIDKINNIIERNFINTRLLNDEVFETICKKDYKHICILWIKLGYKPKPSSLMYEYYENNYTFMTIA